MPITSAKFLEAIRKSLIILIILMFIEQLLTLLYLAILYPTPGGDWSGEITFAINTLFDVLAIYLISRDNIIGDIIVFYQNFVSLQLSYEVGDYYGLASFIKSPQAMFTDVISLITITVIIIHSLFIVKRKFKPKSFTLTHAPQASSFMVKHKLNVVLLFFFAALIIFYWGLWAALR